MLNNSTCVYITYTAVNHIVYQQFIRLKIQHCLIIQHFVLYISFTHYLFIIDIQVVTDDNLQWHCY